MFGFGGGWGLLIFEALGLGLRVWGFGFCVFYVAFGFGGFGILGFWVLCFGMWDLGVAFWVGELGGLDFAGFWFEF